MDGLLDIFIKGICDMSTTALEAEELKIENDMLTVAGKLAGYVAFVGMGLTIIYFLLEINQKLAFEGRDGSFKPLYAPIFKLCGALGLMSQAPKITGGILSFSNAITGEAAGISLFESPSVTDLDNEIKTCAETFGALGFFEKAFLLLPLLLMWVISLAIGLVWSYKALQYKLELVYRITVTPIAFSDLYNGANSHAIRWFKGFIAFTLYGASLIAIPKIGTDIQAGTAATAFKEAMAGDEITIGIMLKSFLNFLILPFAELGVLGAIKQAIKEGVG